MLLIVIAAIIVPGILGCCMPKQITGNYYESETKYAHYFLVDYEVKKFIDRPINVPNGVAFLLGDIAAGKMYTMMKDGSCKKMSFDQSIPYNQCYQANSSVGNFYLGPKDSVKVQTFTYSAGVNNFLFGVAEDKCIPVITVARYGRVTRTTIFGNVTEKIVMNDLDEDVSSCVETVG